MERGQQMLAAFLFLNQSEFFGCFVHKCWISAPKIFEAAVVWRDGNHFCGTNNHY